MKRNLIIIYSRTGSRRLPSKALLPIKNINLIELIIKRVKKFSDFVDADIVLATTNKNEDDVLEKIASKNGICHFRGNELNLVERTLAILKKLKYKNFCRVNGDCPLVDGNLIKKAYSHLNKNYDLVTNIDVRTFPYGIAVEWVDSSVYIKYASNAFNEEKEHVTKHLYRLKDKINFYNILNDRDLSHFNLTIDTQKDYENFKKLISNASTENLIEMNFDEILKNKKNDNSI